MKKVIGSVIVVVVALVVIIALAYGADQFSQSKVNGLKSDLGQLQKISQALNNTDYKTACSELKSYLVQHQEATDKNSVLIADCKTQNLW
jgi:uncharacterized protein HemX